MKGIHIEELYKETRLKLGLSARLDHENVERKLIVLGKVLHSLNGLNRGEATWIIKQVLFYLMCDDENEVVNISEELPEFDRQGKYSPPIRWVIKQVAMSFNVRPIELKQRGRDAHLVVARQVTYYVLWQWCGYTLTQIGEGVGGRSAATVSHGYQKIAGMLGHDIDLRQKVASIGNNLFLS